MAEDAGHAFICYVREDARHADEVQRVLTAAGIPIWRDTENLWPGEDWRERIRDAITEGAFAFVPIFSSASVAKGVSGQNEELYLAAEEMRKRQPGSSWMFPVRFDDCRLPRLRLGGDRMLDGIQRADLFGDDAGAQADRLVQAIQRLTARDDSSPPDAAQTPIAALNSGDRSSAHRRPEMELREALRDPSGDIRLHDLLMPIADATSDGLADVERYPVQGNVTVREIAHQIDNYWTDLSGLLDLFIAGAPWSREEHARTWTEAVQRIARASTVRSGNVARLSARWFPLVALTYAGGLAALYRENYGFLRAIAVDAMVRDDNHKVPVVARARPWLPFENTELAAQILALEASGEVVDDDVVEELRTGRKGKRYTPASDLLHDRLRDRLRPLYPDDNDYSDAFDRLETLLALQIADLDLQSRDADNRVVGPYIGSPYPGRASWRERHADDSQVIEARMRREWIGAGARWRPLAAGLLGGSVERAEAAFESYHPTASQARSSRW